MNFRDADLLLAMARESVEEDGRTPNRMLYFAGEQPLAAIIWIFHDPSPARMQLSMCAMGVAARALHADRVVCVQDAFTKPCQTREELRDMARRGHRLDTDPAAVNCLMVTEVVADVEDAETWRQDYRISDDGSVVWEPVTGTGTAIERDGVVYAFRAGFSSGQILKVAEALTVASLTGPTPVAVIPLCLEVEAQITSEFDQVGAQLKHLITFEHFSK